MKFQNKVIFWQNLKSKVTPKNFYILAYKLQITKFAVGTFVTTTPRAAIVLIPKAEMRWWHTSQKFGVLNNFHENNIEHFLKHHDEETHATSRVRV